MPTRAILLSVALGLLASISIHAAEADEPHPAKKALAVNAPAPAKAVAATKMVAATKAAKPAQPANSEDEFDPVPQRIPAITGPVFREVRSIPYPNGAIYLRRGITGSFLGGKHRNLGEAQSLYQWQGEMGYYYKPWFSAGAGFRITAGEPYDTAQKVVNRYFLLTRFHMDWSNAAIFIGPQLGFENLNVLSGNPVDTVNKILTKPIDDTKASLGLELGGGWKFSRWAGVTLGGNLEYSLVTNNINNLNLHVLPGLSIDVLAFTDTLRELVPALYVYVEFQSGFLVFEKKRLRQDQAAIIGLGVAF